MRTKPPIDNNALGSYLSPDHHRDKTRRRLTDKPCPLGRQLSIVGRCRGEANLSTSSPSSKDLTKQPLQEPTRAPFFPLPWRAQGTVRGSLEDSRIVPNTVKASRIVPNTVKASNRPQQTNLLKTGPTGHVNPFVDIEINSL
jgi:hypothetical protein